MKEVTFVSIQSVISRLSHYISNEDYNIYQELHCLLIAFIFVHCYKYFSKYSQLLNKTATFDNNALADSIYSCTVMRSVNIKTLINTFNNTYKAGYFSHEENDCRNAVI